MYLLIMHGINFIYKLSLCVIEALEKSDLFQEVIFKQLFHIEFEHS